MADLFVMVDDVIAAANRLYAAIDDAVADSDPGDCYRAHCDDYSCDCPEPTPSTDAAWDIGEDYLRQIRMGYTLDATLQDVLEEMERSVS